MIDNKITKWAVGIILVGYMLFMLSSALEGIQIINDAYDQFEPYLEFQEEEESLERLLVENHYEVLTVHIGRISKNAPILEQYGIIDNTVCDDEETICYTDKVSVSIEVKSLGSRDDQLVDNLISMGVIYEDAFIYNLWIVEPTRTCKYRILGETYRNRDYTSMADEIAKSEDCS